MQNKQPLLDSDHDQKYPYSFKQMNLKNIIKDNDELFSEFFFKYDVADKNRN